MFSLDVLRLWSGAEVRVQHGKDGAGEGVGGDVDLDLARGSAERMRSATVPEGIGGGSLEEFSMGRTGGFKREDLAFVTVLAAEHCELARVGAHVNEEVDPQQREELAMTQLLRAVEARLSNREPIGFSECAQSVLNRRKHLL